ncbi:MAG: hypothetical protein AAF725_16565 [Acidobacteriota bacterium]
MNRTFSPKPSLGLSICLALLLLAAVPAAAEDLTLEQVISKNIEAMGGADAWKAVESAKVQGKMTMAGGFELPMTLYFMRPGKVRVEMEMQGQKIVQAFDGETGWQIMPMMGKLDPQEMSEDEVKMVKNQADFEGPLLNYKDKGHQVELVGKEEIDGTEAYKLKVTLKSGDIAYSYLDTEYFLEFKQEANVPNPAGVQMKTMIDVGDYKEIGDIVFPHSRTVQPEGLDQSMSVVFESVELNPEDVDGELFAMPAVETSAAQ